MERVTRSELLPGVFLTAVQTTKFKSDRFTVAFLTPLVRKDAAMNALLPWVLCRGSRRYPDMRAISNAMDELYGGSVEPLVEKKGEVQCVGFTAEFMDGAFAPGGERILQPAAELLGELLLHPRTERGVFCEAYVRSERENLIDRIRALVNDKRQYALLRLGQEMCADEAFGIPRFGDEETAARIEPDGLWARYQHLLSRARVELCYIGSASAEQAAEALRRALADLPTGQERQCPRTVVRSDVPGQPRTVVQPMEVTQGKLAIGFRTGGIHAGDARYPALLLLNAVYGGTSMSKLFMNVRERLSLCYFASSMLEKWKGIMRVSSGIEFDRYDEALREILAQLDACRRGEISEDELTGARRIVVTALRTAGDSQRRLADYWLGQAVSGLTGGPEELIERVERVTAGQIIEAANAIRIDTIYFLTGKEAAR